MRLLPTYPNCFPRDYLHVASFQIRIRETRDLLFGLFETLSNNLTASLLNLCSLSSHLQHPPYPPMNKADKLCKFFHFNIFCFTKSTFFFFHESHMQNFFLLYLHETLSIIHQKGVLSTSPFESHSNEWKTRHVWLFNADSSHLQEQNSWIIKIKHNRAPLNRFFGLKQGDKNGKAGRGSGSWNDEPRLILSVWC